MIDPKASPDLKTRIETVVRTMASSGVARHYGGFILAGASAFAVDALVLLLLTGWGLSPLLARPCGISLAMIVSWWINRTVTFASTSSPSVGEFARFAAVAWFAQAVNYAIFAAVLLVRPATAPLVALIVACFIAMFVSYAGYRYGVFSDKGRDH